MMKPTLYPVVDEITIVVPTKITDLGIYVALIEYNNMEGLIAYRELSKSRIHSINKVARIGKKFPACVLTIEEQTKFITLSKKAVSKTEASKCESDYYNLKYVHDLVNFFSKKMQRDHNIILESDYIYREFIWSISTDPENLLVGLKTASIDFNKIYSDKLANVDFSIINTFKEVLALKFKEKDVLLEAVMEICCYETGGIDIIKEALSKGELNSTNQFPFKIKLVKSPYYAITLKTREKEAATQLILSTINLIGEELNKHKAIMKIIKVPQIVTDSEFQPEESAEESDEESDEESS